MNRILIIGCGDIAMRVAPMLGARYRLFGLVRNAARFDELRAAGITPVHGDLDDLRSLSRIAGLADTVLHFAPPAVGSLRSSGAAPRPPGGRVSAGAASTETPPSAPLLQRGESTGRGSSSAHPTLAKGGRGGFAATDSRTRNLLAVLSRSTPPKHLIYISTSSVYGDCGGAYVYETHPLNPQTARAQLRVDAERQIRDWAKRNGVQASILRVPGIYAADRLPLERLRAGTPAIAAIEDSYTNLIHADDLARIVVAAMRYTKPNRVVHTSDDSELKMGEYFDAVADACSLPRPIRLPRVEVERSVSPALWSFMNESRRLGNARMKRELKVKLRYPTVADLLAGMKGS